MTRRAPLTRICTRIASCSTQHLTPLKPAGRRCRTTSFYVQENLPRTLTTTNFLGNCDLLAIRFAIEGGVILRSRVSPKNCVNGFPSGTHRLTKHLPSCSRINRNYLAEISRICASNWPLQSDLENRNP